MLTPTRIPASPVAGPTCVRGMPGDRPPGAGGAVALRVGSRPTRIRLQGTRSHLPDDSQEGYGPPAGASAPRPSGEYGEHGSGVAQRESAQPSAAPDPL